MHKEPHWFRRTEYQKKYATLPLLLTIMQHGQFVNPKNQFLRVIFLLLCIGSMLLGGCHALSKGERKMSQQSPEALCTAIVKCYKSQDLKAFLDLAVSFRELKDLMKNADLPAAAKRESINKLGAHGYATLIQDSLSNVLKSSGLPLEKIKFEKFLPSRNPVETAKGYHMILGKMQLSAGGSERYVQPITIVEIGQGRFLAGDFSPILPEK